jgi:hypothetical protein
MSFFTRPDLSDISFKQLNDSVLTLSGTTRYNNITGLTINDGTGNYIPIVVTGASSGYSLTYTNGVFSPQPSGAGSTPSFDSNRATTRSGIPVVTVSGNTVQQFLEGYFFPSLPLSTTLSIATGGNLRQFGDCSLGDLCWNVIRNTYPISNIYVDNDANGTYNCTILSSGSVSSTGGTLSYTYPFICATPTSACTSTSITFSLSANTCINEGNVSQANVVWNNKKFYFGNSTYYYDDSISFVLSGLTGELSTVKTLTLSNMSFNDEFFYYAYPKVLGLPNVSVNGLPNNAWGNINTGTLFTITYINTNDFSNQYYVLRSNSKITGTYNISIT